MRRLRWASGVALSVVVFVGCSGKGQPSTAATTTSTSTAATSTTATSGAVGSAASTTVPSFSGSSSSKFCVLARQFSSTINGNLAGDAKTLFQQFDAQSAQYLALVPAPIKSDAQTVVDGLHQLEASFQAVNYDVTKITPAALAPLQTPQFAAAASRINAYDTQVCGISPPST